MQSGNGEYSMLRQSIIIMQEKGRGGGGLGERGRGWTCIEGPPGPPYEGQGALVKNGVQDVGGVPVSVCPEHGLPERRLGALHWSTYCWLKIPIQAYHAVHWPKASLSMTLHMGVQTCCKQSLHDVASTGWCKQNYLV